MKPLKFAVYAVLFCSITVGSIGCFPNTLNDLVSAGIKLASGQVGDLTASEIKTLNQVAVDVIKESTGTELPPLTDDQAAAIVTFFDANNIQTVDDVEALAQQAQSDPSQIEGLTELAAAFAGTDINIDPNNVDPQELEELFQSIFTGSSGAPDFT